MSVAHQISENSQNLTISIHGELRIDMNSEIMSIIEQNGVSEYRIDLADVEHLDSTALGMLLVYREKARQTHAEIRLINASPEIRHFLTLTQFNKLFHVDS